MALITRCPACATAFRVGEAQLRLRQGWVRCGVCNEVFDARTDLSEKAPEDLAPPASGPPAAPEQGPASQGKTLGVEPMPLESLPVPLLYGDEPGLAPARPVNVDRLDLRQVPMAPAAGRAPAGPPKTRTEPSFDAARLPRVPAPILVEPPSAEPPPLPPVPVFSTDTRPPPVGSKVRANTRRQEPQWGPDPIPVPQMRLAEPVSARVSFFNERGHDVPVLNADPAVFQPVLLEAGTDPLLGTPDAQAPSFGPMLPSHRPLRWPWALGVIVAVCLLVFQFAYVFRAQIATHVPETRPYLQQLCALMKCEVGHLTDAALLSIESSSIEPWQAGAGLSSSRSLVQAGGEPPAEVEFDVRRRLALRVALRNRAPFEQPWPAMELSLTDVRENVVARRVLTPERYLSASAAQDMMGAGSLHVLRVPIDTSVPQASGYRVLFFYP